MSLAYIPMNDWVVVTSEKGFCDRGFPVGEILCLHNNVKEVIQQYHISDPVIRKYNVLKDNYHIVL